jgi:hypothetical protein
MYIKLKFIIQYNLVHYNDYSLAYIIFNNNNIIILLSVNPTSPR